MRIRKILAISVIVLLGGIILWGCRNRENVSSQENSLSEEVCEIAIENMTLGAAYPDTEEVEKMINEITVPAISCKVKIVNCYIGDHANMLKKSRMGIQQLDLVPGFSEHLSNDFACIFSFFHIFCCTPIFFFMKQKDIRKVRSLLNRCTFLVSFSIFLIYLS